MQDGCCVVCWDQAEDFSVVLDKGSNPDHFCTQELACYTIFVKYTLSHIVVIVINIVAVVININN